MMSLGGLISSGAEIGKVAAEISKAALEGAKEINPVSAIRQEFPSMFERPDNAGGSPYNIEGAKGGAELEAPADSRMETPNAVEKPEKVNSSSETEGEKYELDDNGKVFKKNGELVPDNEYTSNGIVYTSDEKGNIDSWHGNPRYTPEGERDIKAQMDVGGKDRLNGDDGGHLVARVMGGSSGRENLVPMRDTINRGDYKRAENEIVSALNDGKEVYVDGHVMRDGENSRPTKIDVRYSYEDKNKELTIDNVEGSTDLLNDVKDSISREDFSSLSDEINDMKGDGHEVSVTSVNKEFGENGEVKNITVGIRDETLKTKTYRTFDGL